MQVATYADRSAPAARMRDGRNKCRTFAPPPPNICLLWKPPKITIADIVPNPSPNLILNTNRHLNALTLTLKPIPNINSALTNHPPTQNTNFNPLILVAR